MYVCGCVYLRERKKEKGRGDLSGDYFCFL